MRPNVSRRYTIQGRAGVCICPTIDAIDKRLTILRVLLHRHAHPHRVRADCDALLDWRLELMAERGATT